MLLLVGLGNPGAGYANNRHNIGFMAVDAIVHRHRFAPWRARFQGQLSEGTLNGEKVLALKPTTFMNNSGQAVGEAARFYKLEPPQVIAFYDELELQPGRLKVKQGGGSAGHNGIRSLDAHLGPAYWRVRLGIGHPGDKARVTGYVLSDFAKGDAVWLEKLLDAVSEAAPDLAAELAGTGDGNRFMTKVALRMNPPLPKTERKDKTPQPEADGPTES
jgi:PTH1 family peptidyl-tRNA hydrolase